MVCIEEVIVCIAEGKLVGHGRYLVLAVVVPAQLVVGEGLYELSLRLNSSAWQSIKWSARAGLAQGGSLAGVPMTRRFLSGNRFPLATESSMELHMSFLGSPFLPSEPPEAVVYVEKRFELDAIVLLVDPSREPQLRALWRLIAGRWQTRCGVDVASSLAPGVGEVEQNRARLGLLSANWMRGDRRVGSHWECTERCVGYLVLVTFWGAVLELLSHLQQASPRGPSCLLNQKSPACHQGPHARVHTGVAVAQTSHLLYTADGSTLFGGAPLPSRLLTAVVQLVPAASNSTIPNLQQPNREVRQGQTSPFAMCNRISRVNKNRSSHKRLFYWVLGISHRTQVVT